MAFERLPEEVLFFVVALLDANDLCSLTACSKAVSTRPTVSSAFRQRTRLVIPPDVARRQELLLQAALVSPLVPRPLPVNIKVEKLQSLPSLDRITGHVRSLTLQQEWSEQRPRPRRHSHPDLYYFPQRVLDWTALSPTRCPGLVELEISLVGDQVLDLQSVYDAAPQLEILRLCLSERAQNENVLHNFRELRVFKSQYRSTSASWDLQDLAGLPKLEELHLENISGFGRIRNTHLLAEIRPLHVLFVRGLWDARLSEDALRVHFQTLRDLQLYDGQQWPATLIADGTRLTSLDASIRFSAITLGLNSLASLPLRKLMLRELSHPSDLDFLPALTELEHLTIRIPIGFDDCRALRHLTNLKTLRIQDGLVCDFIAYLPKLRVLECFDYILTRSFREPENLLTGFTSPVRRAVLKPRIVLTSFAHAVLEQAEEIMISRWSNWKLDWSVLWRLTNVKRLCITHEGDRQLLCKLVDCFQSLEVLEELCLRREGFVSKVEVPSTLLRATRLRVLDLDGPDSLRTIAEMKQLERFYFTSDSAFNLKLLLGLHRLREIGLPAECCCVPLRKARGPGGSLPDLQRIFHPVGDCLVTDQCMRGVDNTVTWHVRHRPEWVRDSDFPL